MLRPGDEDTFLWPLLPCVGICTYTQNHEKAFYKHKSTSGVVARTTFLLWFVLTLNSELSLLQPPEYCDYRCVPPCLIPVAVTESVLGRPDLTLVYVQGVDGCVWYVVAATASAVSLQTQWLFYAAHVS